MADKAWKAFERRVAKDLGGQRNPYSGSSRNASGPSGTGADVIHPYYFIECKSWGSGRVPVWDAFLSGRARAKRYGRGYAMLLDPDVDPWRALVVLDDGKFKLMNPTVVRCAYGTRGWTFSQNKTVTDHLLDRGAPFVKLYAEVVRAARAEVAEKRRRDPGQNPPDIPVLCVARKRTPGYLVIVGVGAWQP